MTKLKENKQYIMCIVVLTAICLFISAALALINSVTLPVITEASAKRAEAARIEVLPEADGFEEIILEEKPETVTQIFEATNGKGYVIMSSVKGYGGAIEIICGIDENGCITQTKTLSHGETAGLGAKIDTDEFISQYVGKDVALEGVSTISGATISSTAYRNAIKEAFTAYEMAAGTYSGADVDAVSGATESVEEGE
ncbi:MAG: FMN-binding protein [Ruminococcaceae bacterium]|nr:FMN-binding protein [Oscillospiraceae bacterium]